MNHALHNVTAAILAGGLGTRLRMVLPDQPKVLAEVAGKPFLAHLLDQLSECGARRAVLCTGYRADAVAKRFGNEYRGMALEYSRETEPLGTAGALRRALPNLDSDPVLVLNGDSYCASAFVELVNAHRCRSAEATVLLSHVSDSGRYGKVELDEENAIRRFAEKSPGGGPGWINAGIYLLSQHFLAALGERTPLSLEREVFPSWVGRGLFGHPSDGWFIDIGTPESFAEAERLFREKGLARCTLA